MRISTSMIFDRGVNAMLDKQRDLSHSELQLATGRRILTPEDDPAAAARILDLDRAVETVSQHQENIDRAKSRLELEDATLDGVGNLLQRARELTVQAASDTLSPPDRAAVAYEIEQLRDQLVGLANTRDSNGEYIFAGYQGDAYPAAFGEVPPGSGNYVYNGDLGQRLIRISYDRQIADGDNGFDLFMNVGAGLDADGDGVVEATRDAFSTLDMLARLLQGTAYPAPGSGLESEDANQIANYVRELDGIMGNVLDTRARVGARLNAIDEQHLVNEDFLVSMQSTRSDEQDLDYAEAVSRFQQQLAALQASQQSFLKVQDLNLFNYL